MYKIFCTKTIPRESFSSLDKAKYEIEIWDDRQHGPIPRKTLLEKVANVDGLITMLSDQVDQELIDKAKRLKVVSQYAVGHNNIDVKYAAANGISVTNTPDVLTHATAELAFALLLTCARKIKASANSVDKDQWKGWEPLGFLGKSLKRSKVAVIGAGRIGQEFARMCHGAFDSEIYYVCPSTKIELEKSTKAQKLSLKEALAICDVISIHTPLTAKTHFLLNDEALKECKSDAIIINTARGEIIDQEALISHLRKGKFFAIGLDVTTPEPLQAHSPLKSFENVVITPHIGSATTAARLEMGSLCAENIMSTLEKNSPITPVTI